MSRDWHDPAGILRSGPGALVAEAWATWPEPGIPSTPATVERVGWFLPEVVGFAVVRAASGRFHTLYVAERLVTGQLARCVHYTLGWKDPATTQAVLGRCAARFARDGRQAVRHEAPVVFGGGVG